MFEEKKKDLKGKIEALRGKKKGGNNFSKKESF